MANPANSTAYRLPDGRMAVNVTEAKTLALADCGYVQNVIYADGVVTLPATAVLGSFTIRNGGVPTTNGPAGTGDDGNKISVTPNASDKVAGGVDGTATDGKPFENTAATARVGDEITILNTGATDGGVVSAVKGIWVRNNA
jgi:hypothetical protein